MLMDPYHYGRDVYLSNSVCHYNKLNIAKKPVNYVCPFEDIYVFFWFVWVKTDSCIPSNKWDEPNDIVLHILKTLLEEGSRTGHIAKIHRLCWNSHSKQE
jgi:hypothetical protein